jgi:hypothetical protein
MVSSVGFISAVIVMLSLGQVHSQSGPEVRMETSKAVVDAVGMVCTATTGSQETKTSRIGPMGNNRKMLGNIFLMPLSIS